jgi:phosphatidylinositol N-acetylglucosaminyltransferase subunit C
MMTLAFATSSISLTAPLSSIATALFGGAQGAVVFIAPAVLVWAQRFKKFVHAVFIA